MSEMKPDWADEAAANIVDVWVVPSTGYANASALKEYFAQRLRDEREACARAGKKWLEDIGAPELAPSTAAAIRNREDKP